jgi:hypothetical protein
MKTPSGISAIVVLSFQASILWGVQPSAFTHLVQPIDLVAPIVPEGVDVEALSAEDAQRDPEGGPYRFAIRRDVMVTPQTDGVWENLGNDLMLWRVQIASPGAVSLSLGFTRYSMPADARLFIYSSDYSQVLGPYTAQDNKEHGQLWTPLLYSDSIIVELTIPLLEVPDLELELTAINHGYRGHDPFWGLKELGESGPCNWNVTCSQGNGWQDQIRSVAWFQITRGVSTAWGTGTLVNNTDQNDAPYFLTAFHCLDDIPKDGKLSDAERNAAATMVFYWNYQAASCSGTTPSAYQTQNGATLVAAYQPTDFALVRLDSLPPANANVFYAGWDRSDTVPSSAVTIHHPQFDLKKISREDHPLSVTSYYENSSPGDGTCLRVANWEVGTTEEASSGCPLFNPDKRVVGQLHGGKAACSGNMPNGQPDWFGRLCRSWTGGGDKSTRLSYWLDHANTGVLALNGKSPGCPARISGYVLTGPATPLPPGDGELILEPPGEAVEQQELLETPPENPYELPVETPIEIDPGSAENPFEPPLETPIETDPGSIVEVEVLPVSGVTIVANPGGHQTISNSDGSFSLAVPCGWSGTLSASLQGWAFDISPQSFTTVVSPIATAITAHAVPITTVTVFGWVTYSNGTGISGVTVATGSGLSTTTDFFGHYSIEVPYGWSGRVTAYKTGSGSFSPDWSPYFSNLTANQQQDFVGQQTLTISGRVSGASNVTISTDDFRGPTTTTDTWGYYKLVIPFSGSWSGKVIPSKTGYKFSPPYKQFSGITYDRTADFTAT